MYPVRACSGLHFSYFREFLVVEIVLWEALLCSSLSLSLFLSSRRCGFIFFFRISLAYCVTFSLSRVSFFFRLFPFSFTFYLFCPCCVLLVKSVTKGILIARIRHHHHHHVSFNRCWCVPFLFVLDARSASFSFFLCV